MNFFSVLEILGDVSVITAEVIALFVAIRLWRKQRLRFALWLGAASALGLLISMYVPMSRRFQLSEQGTEVAWGICYLVSAFSAFCYGAALVQMARHFRGKEPSMPKRPDSSLHSSST